ncbi:MAG: hypothetical protein ACOYMZ_03485 [Minisyncoccia bacterium]
MKALLGIIAVALLIIAGNLTYTNVTNNQLKTTDTSAREEVVEVVGRYTTVFDGLGKEIGFLVKSSKGMEIIHYDEGSMAANKGWEPKYLQVSWANNTDKRPIVSPGTVE